MWHSPGLTSPVSQISPSPIPSSSSGSSSSSPSTFAVSYADGSIRLWAFSSNNSSEEPTELVTFNGHKKGISTLSWDASGTRLASGGTEGEIVVWDRIAEVGLFRLKGHRGAVTGIKWIPHPTMTPTQHPGYLVSTAKDTYAKVWDLATQHCVQTVVVGRGEVVSCDLNEEDEEEPEVETADGQGRNRDRTDTDETDQEHEVKGRWVLITGSGDGEAKVWAIEKAKLAKGMVENDKGEVSKSCSSELRPSLHPRPFISSPPHPSSTLHILLLPIHHRTSATCFSLACR
jgi:U3 small nucleolar RNA-associated protein 12